MTDDLIARLRWTGHADEDAAADALEEQARRIAELETKIIDDRKVMALNLALIEKQAWRIAELKAVLKDLIEDHEYMTQTDAEEDNMARRAARAALGR